MKQLAEQISSDPYLQSIAIFVAVGTLIYFLYRAIPLTIGLLVDTWKFGLRYALALWVKPAVSAARDASKDQRLLILWTGLYLYRCVSRLLAMILVYLILVALMIALVSDPYYEVAQISFLQLKWRHLISLFLSPVFAIYFFTPFVRCYAFVRMSRRKILRQIGEAQGAKRLERQMLV